MRISEAEAPGRVAQGGGTGRNPGEPHLGAEVRTAAAGRTKSEDGALMERVVERSNMVKAYKRVMQNRGSAGVDDLTTLELKDCLKAHWPSVKQERRRAAPHRSAADTLLYANGAGLSGGNSPESPACS